MKEKQKIKVNKIIERINGNISSCFKDEFPALGMYADPKVTGGKPAFLTVSD